MTLHRVSLSALLLPLLLATSSGTEPAKPGCCPPPAPTPPRKACCAEAAPSTYSRDSLYQLEGRFFADDGSARTLGELRGRPVVIAMFFASCTYACPLLLSDLAQLREKLPEPIRSQAALVLVSFDTARDTPDALHAFRRSRQLDAQWTLLHGKSEVVTELAALLGVKYTRQPDGQFAHSNVLTVLNAEGEIVHQRAGLSGGHEGLVAALRAAGSKQ